MHSQVERSLAHADAALAAMLQNAAVLHQCTSDDAFYLHLSQWHSRGVSPSPIPSYISAQFDIPLAGLTYNDIAYLARAYRISRGQSGDAL